MSAEVRRPIAANSLTQTLLAPVFGALLGLSAPGFDQWYLAWIGLVPFFLLSATARNYRAAALRGYLFGLAYNLVALSWLLKLSPPWWLGVQSPTHVLSAALLAWVNVCVIQATVSLALACLARALMLRARGSLAPVVLVALPVSWVVLTHYIFINADLLLLSFSSIEYSQYQQLPLIQIAAWIGGVGVELLIVTFNLAFAVLIVAVFQQDLFARIAAPSVGVARVQFLGVVAAVVGASMWGAVQLGQPPAGPRRAVSVVQLNLSAKYDHAAVRPDAGEIWNLCKDAMEECPQGLIVFSESILPDYVLLTGSLKDEIQQYARAHGSDLIMGVWEKTNNNQMYNSVISFPESDRFRSAIYRKRYLMPVGEFEPFVMRFLGEPGKRILHFSLMPDIQRGTEATALSTRSGDIGVLVCAENSQPKLCAESVNSNTNLLVNLGTLTWFEGSHLGDLSKSAATFRAIENRRSLVYASDTGPSFIVDPSGRVLATSQWSQRAIIKAQVPLCEDGTPFNTFCKMLPNF